VLAYGQHALARVSYLVSTRAKARLKPKTGQYLSGALPHIAPGLTVVGIQLGSCLTHWMQAILLGEPGPPPG
jgi:hypothetical protein